MTATKIQWAQAVWNPTTGCDRISPGCQNCYALTMARRLKAMGAAKYQSDGDPRTSGPGFGVAVHPDALEVPLRWRIPRRVFVNSMSDIAHPRIPRSFVVQMWAVMALARRHHFLVLSKRPQRLAATLGSAQFASDVADEAAAMVARKPRQPAADKDVRFPLWPLPNVWAGTSIESDEYCWRADKLRQVPAAVRFLSLEPLLGPLPTLELTAIDWVIAGGESGHRHRPLNLSWVRDVRDHCVAQQVPFFFKQVGGRHAAAGGRLLDGRTWDEVPTAEGLTVPPMSLMKMEAAS